jgi:hypothetical protein
MNLGNILVPPVESPRSPIQGKEDLFGLTIRGYPKQFLHISQRLVQLQCDGVKTIYLGS